MHVIAGEVFARSLLWGPIVCVFSYFQMSVIGR